MKKKILKKAVFTAMALLLMAGVLGCKSKKDGKNQAAAAGGVQIVKA